MQSLQQQLGDATRALELVGRGYDLRPELAGGPPDPDWSGCPCVTSDWQAIAAAARANRAPLPAVSPRHAADRGLVNRPLWQRQPRHNIGEHHAHLGADAYSFDFGLRREHTVRPHQVADDA